MSRRPKAPYNGIELSSILEGWTLLGRPEGKVRRGRREGDAQGRGRPRLRSGHLLRQAQRRHGSRGEAPGPKKRPGSKPKLDAKARGSSRRRTSRSGRQRPSQRGASS